VVLAVALVLVSWGSGLTPLAAQDKFEIRFSTDPKGTQTPLDSKKSYPLVRPNTTQPIYFFVRNLSGAKQEKLTVKVLANGTERSIGQADLQNVPNNTTQMLVFKAPAPAPPPPGKEPAVKGASAEKPAPAVKGMPLTPLPDRNLLGFRLQIQGDGNAPETREVPVNVATPEEYVEPVAFSIDRDNNRFRAVVRLKEGFSGPPCPVELVLLPAQIPGLVPSRTRMGVYRQVLKKEPGRDTARLSADNLRFEGEKGIGYVYLTIDNYPRAFIIPTDFRGEGVAQAKPEERRHLAFAPGRRFWPPTVRYPVGLEIDGVGKEEKVQVALDRDRDKSFAEKVEKTGPREELIECRIAEDGALAFQTVVRDWTVDLDVDGLLGDFVVQARFEAVPKIDGKSKGEAREVSKTVTFDSSPPEIVKFTVAAGAGEREMRLARGKLLTLVATGVDEESGIAEAAFFLGKVSAEGKVPGEPVAVRRPEVDKKTGELAFKKEFEARAELPGVTEKPGTLDVAVQFTNGAGMKSFGELKIILVDEDKKSDGKKGAGDGKAKLGSVAGTVSEGERPQKGLVVSLRDIKGAEVKATTKTDAKGNYLFADVPPGPYRVFSENPGSKTTGSAPAQVEAGKKTEGIDISLLRR
jgi:hypothetical protein